MLKNVNLSEINFEYLVDCEYDSDHSCDESGCNEEGICRCGTIENARIESVNIDGIVEHIYGLYFPQDKTTKRDDKLKNLLFGIGAEVDKYCIDRICRTLKIWESDCWDVSVTGGYYGQEIGSVKLESINSLQTSVDKVLSFNTLKEKIDYLLICEYGNLLPELKDKNYEIVDIPKDSIIFGSKSQLEKVSTEKLDHYDDKNYDGIRSLVIENGTKYRLIDGYHRTFTTKSKTVRAILAV